MEKDAVREKATPKSQKAKEETLSIENDLLYRKSRLWVPEGIVQKILESAHDTKLAGYMGQDKTMEHIR